MDSTLDRLAAAAFLLVSVVLLAAMPAWRMDDRPPVDAYAESAPAFLARAEAFAARHATGAETDGLPVVAPPPGDVPVVARRYQFWPALELEAGHTYRLHVASIDTVHSVAIDGHELLLIPGEVRVIEVRPSAPLTLQCGEYCGLGHNKMRGSIRLRPDASAPPAAR
ncbi:MAG: quinol oxidase [Solirubrobacterales bacterium]